MADDKLTMKQQAALLVLMAESREMTNPDLIKVAGFEIDKPSRERLTELGFVEVRKDGQTNVYQLTPDGWSWCKEAARSGRAPTRSGPAGGALFNLLRNLGRNLSRIGYETPIEILEADRQSQVRAAYARVSRRAGAPIALNKVRDRLSGLDPEDLDATLRTMARLPDVHLIAEDNLPALTDDERKAAIQIGGNEKHLIAIEPTP